MPSAITPSAIIMLGVIMLYVIMLYVIILSDYGPSVIMRSEVTLNVMLSVVKPSVIRLSVVAPLKYKFLSPSRAQLYTTWFGLFFTFLR